MIKMKSFASAALASAVIVVAGIAAAEEQFDVSAAKGAVTVATKGHWHINKDYPWKVVVGDQTFDKSKFTLTETTATLSGLPQGTVRLKGAVCDGPQCLPFSKEVTVQ